MVKHFFTEKEEMYLESLTRSLGLRRPEEGRQYIIFKSRLRKKIKERLIPDIVTRLEAGLLLNDTCRQEGEIRDHITKAVGEHYLLFSHFLTTWIPQHQTEGLYRSILNSACSYNSVSSAIGPKAVLAAFIAFLTKIDFEKESSHDHRNLALDHLSSLMAEIADQELHPIPLRYPNGDCGLSWCLVFSEMSSPSKPNDDNQWLEQKARSFKREYGVHKIPDLNMGVSVTVCVNIPGFILTTLGKKMIKETTKGTGRASEITIRTMDQILESLIAQLENKDLLIFEHTSSSGPEYDFQFANRNREIFNDMENPPTFVDLDFITKRLTSLKASKEGGGIRSQFGKYVTEMVNRGIITKLGRKISVTPYGETLKASSGKWDEPELEAKPTFNQNRRKPATRRRHPSPKRRQLRHTGRRTDKLKRATF